MRVLDYFRFNIRFNIAGVTNQFKPNKRLEERPDLVNRQIGAWAAHWSVACESLASHTVRVLQTLFTVEIAPAPSELGTEFRFSVALFIELLYNENGEYVIIYKIC